MPIGMSARLTCTSTDLCGWVRICWSPLWMLYGSLRFARREPQTGPFDVHVIHRGDVERQQLRDEESADDRHTERAPRLGPGTQAERDRQRADERTHRRH